MPVQIRVQNLQSIEDATVVVDGFTAVTGPNNSGKTAIVRAIHGVFTNPAGEGLVRYGADSLDVSLTFQDGHDVRWRKGPRVKPTYVVDGRTIHPGRDVPAEVLALGVRPIQAGTSDVWPQVAPQFTGQMFLLDLPGSATAEALSDVERVGRLNSALKMAESDRRNSASELRTRTSDSEALRVQLSRYAGLDAAGSSVATVESLAAAADRDGADIEVLLAIRRRIRFATDIIDRLSGIRDIAVSDVGRVTEAQTARRRIEDASVIRTRLTDAHVRVRSMEGIATVTVPPTPSETMAIRGRLRDATGLRERWVLAYRQVDSLADVSSVHIPPVPAEGRAIRDQLGEARSLSERRAIARDLLEDSAALAAVSSTTPKLASDVGNIRKIGQTLSWATGLRARRDTVVHDGAALETTLREEEAALHEAITDVGGMLGSIGRCPVCRMVLTSGGEP